MQHALHNVHRNGSTFAGAKDFRRFLEEKRASHGTYDMARAALQAIEGIRGSVADGPVADLEATLAGIPQSGAGFFDRTKLPYDSDRPQLYLAHMQDQTKALNFNSPGYGICVSLSLVSGWAQVFGGAMVKAGAPVAVNLLIGTSAHVSWARDAPKPTNKRLTIPDPGTIAQLIHRGYFGSTVQVWLLTPSKVYKFDKPVST